MRLYFGSFGIHEDVRTNGIQCARKKYLVPDQVQRGPQSATVAAGLSGDSGNRSVMALVSRGARGGFGLHHLREP